MNECPNPTINHDTIDTYVSWGVAIGFAVVCIDMAFGLKQLGWIILCALGLFAVYATHEKIFPMKPGMRIMLVRTDINYTSKPYRYYQYTNDPKVDAGKIKDIIEEYKKIADAHNAIETSAIIAEQTEKDKLANQHGAIMGLLENDQKVPLLQIKEPEPIQEIEPEPVEVKNDGQ